MTARNLRMRRVAHDHPGSPGKCLLLISGIHLGRGRISRALHPKIGAQHDIGAVVAAAIERNHVVGAALSKDARTAHQGSARLNRRRTRSLRTNARDQHHFAVAEHAQHRAIRRRTQRP